MNGETGHIHDPPDGSVEAFNPQAAAIRLLEQCEATAPEGFAERVMAALPEEPDSPWYLRIPRLRRGHGVWAFPTAAGALAVLALCLWIWHSGRADGWVAVNFELHAPDASKVELVGSFNRWSPGEIALSGPDAAGYWSATVKLPPGSHEYLFLVMTERSG